MTIRRRRQTRLLLGLVSTGLIVAGAVVMATSSSAQTAVSPGQGSSYAQLLQVAPHDGSLAVGVTLGEALAGHTLDFARAQSQGVDLGAIGTALTGYNCGSQTFQPDQLPESIETETGAAGASSGVTKTPTSGGWGSTEKVLANSVPYGEADASFAGPVDAGGLDLSGMASKAWSGLVNGSRQAGATSDIGSLSLLNGVVALSGMQWQAVYPSGGSAQPSASFSIGGLVIDGKTVPLPVGQAGLTAAQTAINTVLNVFGFQIEMPVASDAQGIETMSPLDIEAVPNTARDNLLNGVLTKLDPLLDPIKTGLETSFGPWEPSSLATVLCQSDTPLTVADVAVASFTGAGYFSTEVGGVNASSASVAGNNYHLNPAPTLSSLPPTSSFVPGSGSSSSTPSTPGTPASPAVPATPGTETPVSSGSTSPSLASPSSAGTTPSAASSTSTPVEPVSETSAGFAAGGPLLAIGLAGLAVLALLAELDRRMMRRAQHTVTFEE